MRTRQWQSGQRVSTVFIPVCSAGLQLLCSQVVDLGNLVVEGLLKVALRGDVLLDLLDVLYALHVAGNQLVLLVELVVGQELDKITHLKHVEVQVSEV